MRLATIRVDGGTAAARIDGDDVLRLPPPDLRTLIAEPDWTTLAEADGPRQSLTDTRFDALTRPPRTFCLGLNYESHIEELGVETPEYPLLFAKFPEALIGPNDDIPIPSVSERVDPEAELAAVIGRPARRIDEKDALDHVAGYTVANDISMRDWQTRTREMLQGKTFEGSSPVGPVLVTPDEVDHALDLVVRCDIDGEPYQEGRTSDLLFSVANVIAYI
ncbi:MAG: fumarylacetoacetate hydrolase family protein, partial [Acidimicrobiia bacterium]